MGWFVLWVLFLTVGFAGIALLVNKGKEDSKMKDEIKNKAIDLVKEVYHEGWVDGSKATAVHLEMCRQESEKENDAMCHDCKYVKNKSNEEPCLDCCNNYESHWEFEESLTSLQKVADAFDRHLPNWRE